MSVQTPFLSGRSTVTPREARFRYNRDLAIANIVYVVLVLAVKYLLRALDAHGMMLWLLAVLPALPVLRMIQVMGRYLDEIDEYMRALHTRRMLAALGVTFAACTFYGFGEAFAAAPHIELYLVYPLFCILYGLSCFVIRSTK